MLAEPIRPAPAFVSPVAFAPSLRRDRRLLALCVVAFLLGCYGIWWGWVECWNPDQMALAQLRPRFHGLLPEPIYHFKPPFHTYLNYYLVIIPLRAVSKIAWWLTGSQWSSPIAVLYGARLLQLLLFVGCVYVSHHIAARAFGRTAGLLVALFTATSAGFVLQAHFLTADIPVTFWMILGFFAAQSIFTGGKFRHYVIAGLLTGVATATKYNGLAVGLAIPLFHWLANPGQPFLKRAFDPRLVLGVGAVVVGFVLADPYAVLNWKAFSTDFYYNYVTTPVYDGQQADGNSFGLFFLRIAEIVGVPAALLLGAGCLGSLAAVRQLPPLARATLLSAIGVFLLYFYKFGSMPRLEVRFVLPAVPFVLIAAAWALQHLIHRYRAIGLGVFGSIAVYNVAASVVVGHRFAHDPRMEAQRWVAQNLSPNTAVESSYYTPYWNRFPGTDVDDVRMPYFFGRQGKLAQAFSAGSKERQMVIERESNDGSEWFNPTRLHERSPEFVAVDSLYYDRFVSGDSATWYPHVSLFFRSLLEQRLGYEIVFDRTAPRAPAWLYPRDIGALDSRIVLLRRTDATRVSRNATQLGPPQIGTP